MDRTDLAQIEAIDRSNAFELGFFKAAQAAGLDKPRYEQMRKVAMEVVNRNYNPLLKRRNLSKDEQELVEQESGKIIPALFPSDADSPAVNMSTPWTPAVLAGGAGALLGGAVGGSLAAGPSSVEFNGLSRPKVDTGFSPVGAGIGAGLGALALGYIGYRLGKNKNTNTEELMRRLPEGASLRDAESDPVEQARMNRESLQRLAMKTASVLTVGLRKNAADADVAVAALTAADAAVGGLSLKDALSKKKKAKKRDDKDAAPQK